MYIYFIIFILVSNYIIDKRFGTDNALNFFYYVYIGLNLFAALVFPIYAFSQLSGYYPELFVLTLMLSLFNIVSMISLMVEGRFAYYFHFLFLCVECVYANCPYFYDFYSKSYVMNVFPSISYWSIFILPVVYCYFRARQLTVIYSPKKQRSFIDPKNQKL